MAPTDDAIRAADDTPATWCDWCGRPWDAMATCPTCGDSDDIPFCPDDPSVCCRCWGTGMDHERVGKVWRTVACACEAGRRYHEAHPHLRKAA